MDAMDIQRLTAAVILGGFGLGFIIELLAGRIHTAKRIKRDLGFSVVGISSNIVISSLLIASLAAIVIETIFPESAGGLAGSPFWLAYGLIFFCNEFAHYWIHRWSHEKRWLWRIHRTHHSATDLNVSVLYRFNVFWALLLPQVWMGAFAFYMGLGGPFAAAIITTFFVNVLTHMSLRWDLWLRKRFPRTEPLWRVIEKVLTLPDTHHAHHAYGEGAHPNGNYAVTLFIFDVIFGTAKIPNRKQKQFGLPISERLHWAEELFWPVIKKPLKPKPVK